MKKTVRWTALLLLSFMLIASCFASCDKTEDCEHTYKRGETVLPACEYMGYTNYVCTKCGKKEQNEFVQASGHFWNSIGVCERCDTIATEEEFPDTSDSVVINEGTYTRVDANGNKSSSGGYIQFGVYPQSKVENVTLAETLNARAGGLPTASAPGNWTSYAYYANSASPETAEDAVDYMWYIDVTEGDNSYRGVYFTAYRPYATSVSNLANESYQDDNGYEKNKIHWFLYEPILWKITDENKGVATLVCETLIDGHEYYNSVEERTKEGTAIHANNYAESDIRRWLNDTFYQTAFSRAQKVLIKKQTVQNGLESTGYLENAYVCENTEDYVYLLSYQEMLSFFSESEKAKKKPTDYALSQGVYADASGMGYWWLRSPCNSSAILAHRIGCDGTLGKNSVEYSMYGICPMLRVRL